MKPLRIPWQVWAVVALAPVLWFLYERPGDPTFENPRLIALGVILACALLLRGSKVAWIFSAAYSGAFAAIFAYQLFDPSGDPSSLWVRVALVTAVAAQFSLLVSRATLDWVGLRDAAAVPPAEHTP